MSPSPLIKMLILRPSNESGGSHDDTRWVRMTRPATCLNPTRLNSRAVGYRSRNRRFRSYIQTRDILNKATDWHPPALKARDLTRSLECKSDLIRFGLANCT
jgi:hypothetical protein